MANANPLARLKAGLYARSIRLRERYTQLYVRFSPVKKNKLVFDNFFGKAYGDTPKYIAEEIHRQGLDWDLVWLVKDDTVEVPHYLRRVHVWSRRAQRELSTARVVVNNVRNSLRVPKKKGQIFLQAWHGGLGFKRIEGEAEEKLSPDYVRSAKRDGRECDAILSACALQTEQFKKWFWLSENTEILEVGQPQCDGLLRADPRPAGQKVRSALGIPEGTAIILYAPTFRDDGSADAYALEYEAVAGAFEKKLGQPCVMVVRLHPNARRLCDSIAYNDRVRNGSFYPDIQELYLASAAVISDYSNVSFQFALLNKPAFLCALDYEEYVALRGLSDLFDRCPFPKSRTNGELIQSIEAFTPEGYSAALNKFKAEVWKPFDDGHAAEKTVAWLKRKLDAQ